MSVECQQSSVSNFKRDNLFVGVPLFIALNLLKKPRSRQNKS
ncbi:hypothetical protein [Nostoc sp. PA-18-2419]|nr:hypothetical protein [Nostoc sp. PA-18-2419]